MGGLVGRSWHSLAMRWMLAVLLGVVAAAAEMPPSPADVPGVRIWPPPQLTHWPAIAYADEQRNAALAIPVQTPGAAGELGWVGGAMLPFTLPSDVEQTSALIDLVLQPGARQVRVALPGAEHRLPLRVVPATEAWPIAGLREGFPVDADGAAVVLLDHRPMPAQERTWALLQGTLVRPGGRALVVGDTLLALNTSPMTGLDAELRPATDLRAPHHACLAALARLPDPLPRTLVWSPGNDGIAIGAADPEEIRLMGTVRNRLAAMGARPLLIVALPPEPAEERLRPVHAARREALIAAADTVGWKVLDLARAAGPADSANRVGDGLYAPYPVGEAQGRVAQALADLLAR
jgi:hypothetical protein